MSLLIPLANATLTQHFANQALSVEPHCYHVGSETCMYNFYQGSVYAEHFHMGTDWAAAQGSAVLACEAGIVQFAGWAASPGPFAGGGNIVVVKIAGGMLYMAAHLSSLNVSSGQSVTRGQRLGSQGHSGTATGDHVHLSIYTESPTHALLFRNPEHYMPGGKYASSPLIQPASLPDTSTGGNVEVLNAYSPAAKVSFPAGTYTGYKLGGATKVGKLASASSAHTSAKVHIDQGVLKTGWNGTFVYITDGIWAGYWVPAAGLTVTP